MVPRPQGSNGTVLHDRSAVRHAAAEYGGSGAKVRDFVSDGATRRVLQMAGHGAEVRITIVNFAGDGRRAARITERFEFVDAPARRGPEAYRAAAMPCGQPDRYRDGPHRGSVDAPAVAGTVDPEGCRSRVPAPAMGY